MRILKRTFEAAVSLKSTPYGMVNIECDRIDRLERSPFRLIRSPVVPENVVTHHLGGHIQFGEFIQ